MKRILIPALAAASLAAAVTPALAQPWDGGRDRGYDHGYNRADDGAANIDAREAQLDRRIDEGVRSGELNQNEAERLRNDLRRVQYVEARYRHNTGYYRQGPGGLSPTERADLDRRLDILSRQVFREKHDDDRRFNR
jgi:hypothetical protein